MLLHTVPAFQRATKIQQQSSSAITHSKIRNTDKYPAHSTTVQKLPNVVFNLIVGAAGCPDRLCPLDEDVASIAAAWLARRAASNRCFKLGLAPITTLNSWGYIGPIFFSLSNAKSWRCFLCLLGLCPSVSRSKSTTRGTNRATNLTPRRGGSTARISEWNSDTYGLRLHTRRREAPPHLRIL